MTTTPFDHIKTSSTRMISNYLRDECMSPAVMELADDPHFFTQLMDKVADELTTFALPDQILLLNKFEARKINGGSDHTIETIAHRIFSHLNQRPEKDRALFFLIGSFYGHNTHNLSTENKNVVDDFQTAIRNLFIIRTNEGGETKDLIQHLNYASLKQLIAQGYRVALFAAVLQTPIYFPINRGIIKILLEGCTDQEFKEILSIKGEDNSALHLACKSGDADSIKVLFERSKKDSTGALLKALIYPLNCARNPIVLAFGSGSSQALKALFQYYPKDKLELSTLYEVLEQLPEHFSYDLFQTLLNHWPKDTVDRFFELTKNSCYRLNQVTLDFYDRWKEVTNPTPLFSPEEQQLFSNNT